MTIYRKLASSSVFALAIALMKRQNRLRQADGQSGGGVISIADVERDTDVAEANDMLSELAVEGTADRFFADELEWLDRLVAAAKACFVDDAKRSELTRLTTELVVQKKGKLLIFTEYRSTQRYLQLAVEKLGVKVALIQGGQSVTEKLAAIASFESDSDVLISTEAGGEGLNLHRQCHVMINYDLPWNPARLIQRIGRLYRYGQQQQVIVINFHARDTIDNEILGGVLERLDKVVAGMAPVNAEFGDRYHAEVMGELLERLDIGDLLAEAALGKVDRTSERIDQAIAAALRAKSLQDEVLHGAERYDPGGWKNLGALSTAHLAAFIQRAAPFLGIEVEPGREIERFTLRLPAELRGKFTEFGGRTVIEATTRRGSSAQRGQAEIMDFAASFVRYLIAAVSSPEFGNGYAAVDEGEARGRLTGVFLSRFQNDQGKPTGEDIVVAVREPDGTIRVDNSSMISLFKQPLSERRLPVADPLVRSRQVDALADRAEVEMADYCNRFQHPNGLRCVAILEAAAD